MEGKGKIMTQQVTYSLAVKRSLPGYQNYTPFYSLTDEVREGETVQEAYARLEEEVESRLGLKIDQLDVELAEG
jgi:hypothetical protein